MYLIPIIVGTIAFAVLAPVVGCLLAGLDRKLSARMQGRVGPPILQPYYDVRKLLEKDRAAVNNVEGTYITCALVFAILAGGIFFGGGNLLLSVFVLTLSSLFFILAAYCTRSPYSEVGAARDVAARRGQAASGVLDERAGCEVRAQHRGLGQLGEFAVAVVHDADRIRRDALHQAAELTHLLR